ncbi:hypothetical protein RvVAR031_30280 [Agrobacterium vitis]|nr:hypothetical protein RvVAR031_30280 [Agrobacterium vitis]
MPNAQIETTTDKIFVLIFRLSRNDIWDLMSAGIQASGLAATGKASRHERYNRLYTRFKRH